MAIDGVRQKSGSGYDIFYVDSLTEHFKDIIRADLSTICHGPRLSASGSNLHTYEKTIKALYERYKNKKPTTKTGMVGELVAHIIIRHHIPELKSISILFNPTEMSIKKGFDLNFLRESQLWYGEVKASNAITSLDSDNKALLTRARSSLVENFEQDELRDSLWHSALFESAIMFDTPELHPITKVLDESHDEIAERAAIATNVILISVPFHSTTTGEVDENEIIAYVQALRDEKIFNDVTVICVQKSLFQSVEDFIKNEAIES